MVTGKKLNPLTIASFISVFLIFSNLFSFPERRSFNCVFESSKIKGLYGKVISSPVINSKQTFYTMDFMVLNAESELGKGSGSGKITLYIRPEIVEAFFPGRLYSISAMKGGTFIENGSLLSVKGSFLRGSFYADQVISCSFEKEGFVKLKRFRALARLQFKRLMYEWKDGGGLLLSLLSGSREYTEADLQDNFRKAGLSHVLALSGMHLSILMGIAVFFGKKMKIYKLMLVFQFISITVFVWFAGFSPSLLRAFICSIVLLFEEITSVRKSSMIEVLSFSFLVQAVLRPDDLFTLGFILSYGALIGILLFGNFFRRFYTRFTPKMLAQSLSASTGAQACTVPVSLKYFGAVSPIGIISTVFVSPLISIFIYSGLVFIILCLLIPGLTGLCGIFLNLLYNLIVILVSFFSKFPLITI